MFYFSISKFTVVVNIFVEISFVLLIWNFRRSLRNKTVLLILVFVAEKYDSTGRNKENEI